MRPGIISLFVVAIILAGCSGSASIAKKEKASAEYEHTATLIESGNYMFTVRTASPSGGKSVQITSHYALKAKDGNYEAYLPYFGRAYSGAYGGDGGIEFNGEPENLEITKNEKKNKISVKFSTQSEKDKFSVTLNVGSSGYGTLTISSQKRQTISYSGSVGELKN